MISAQGYIMEGSNLLCGAQPRTMTLSLPTGFLDSCLPYQTEFAFSAQATLHLSTTVTILHLSLPEALMQSGEHIKYCHMKLLH